MIPVTGVTFAAPLALALLPVLGLIAVTARLFARSRKEAVIADGTLAAAAARRTWRLRLRWLPAAIALLVVVIAQPREGRVLALTPTDGIDIVLAIDVSSSMLQPLSARETRLDAARRVVGRFAESIDGGRVGLVAFQSRAIALSPLTSDHDAIGKRMLTLGPGLVDDGTAIGLGLSEAVTLLEGSPARSRVAVLLTDGENNAGAISPADSARVAQALGVRTYAIAFSGTTANAAGLRAMAEATGGRAFDATTAEQLQRAYDEIGSLERSRVGEQSFVTYRHFGPWLAGAAAALLAVELALRATWLRRYA